MFNIIGLPEARPIHVMFTHSATECFIISSEPLPLRYCSWLNR